MKLRKINMLVCGLAVLIGCSLTGIACDIGSKGDTDNKQNNTETQENTTGTGTQQDTTGVQEGTTGTGQGTTDIQQEENTNIKDGNADTPIDSSSKGNSENNPLNENTNSNDTEGKGSVTPGKVNE